MIFFFEDKVSPPAFRIIAQKYKDQVILFCNNFLWSSFYFWEKILEVLLSSFQYKLDIHVNLHDLKYFWPNVCIVIPCDEKDYVPLCQLVVQTLVLTVTAYTGKIFKRK